MSGSRKRAIKDFFSLLPWQDRYNEFATLDNGQRVGNKFRSFKKSYMKQMRKQK